MAAETKSIPKLNHIWNRQLMKKQTKSGHRPCPFTLLCQQRLSPPKKKSRRQNFRRSGCKSSAEDSLVGDKLTAFSSQQNFQLRVRAQNRPKSAASTSAFSESVKSLQPQKPNPEPISTIEPKKQQKVIENFSRAAKLHPRLLIQTFLFLDAADTARIRLVSHLFNRVVVCTWRFFHKKSFILRINREKKKVRQNVIVAPVRFSDIARDVKLNHFFSVESCPSELSLR